MTHLADAADTSDRRRRPGSVGELLYEPAGHAERVTAFLVDVVVTFVAMFVIAVVLAWISRDLSNWLTWAIQLGGLVYFPVSWVRGGQTIGMLPFHQRVVRAADLGPIGARTAIIRLAGLAVAIVSVVGILLVLVDPQRRGLHDRLAGTLVISG